MTYYCNERGIFYDLAMFIERRAMPALLLGLGILVLFAFAPDSSADPREESPVRIIAIGPNSAEIICALGACDAIVGVSKFCLYPPELSKKPRVGGLFDPDLEKMAALRPDLLVMRGRSDSIETLCEKLGVHVYHDEADSLAGIEKTVRELGAMLGRDQAARKIVADFRGKLSAIRKRVAGRDRPRVFLTVMRQPQRLANILTVGRGTFLHEMIEIAGGVNVFGDVEMTYPQVTGESIIASRPAVIIELLPEVEVTPELAKTMRQQWRDLGPLPAVSAKRIYFVTDDHSLIPSPRIVNVIEKVAKILHPDTIDGD
jgi:cobalamin transport system substrate-binding protein